MISIKFVYKPKRDIIVMWYISKEDFRRNCVNNKSIYQAMFNTNRNVLLILRKEKSISERLLSFVLKYNEKYKKQTYYECATY